MVREKMVEYPPDSGRTCKAVDLTQSQCRELAEHWKRKAQEAAEQERFFDALAEGAPSE